MMLSQGQIDNVPRPPTGKSKNPVNLFLAACADVRHMSHFVGH